jgi:hypothetical protein
MQTQYDNKFKLRDICQEYVKVLAEAGQNIEGGMSPKSSNYQKVITTNYAGNSPAKSPRKSISQFPAANSPRATRKSGMSGSFCLEGKGDSFGKLAVAALSRAERDSNINGNSPRTLQSNLERFNKHLSETMSPGMTTLEKSRLRTHDSGHSIDDLVKMNLSSRGVPPSKSNRRGASIGSGANQESTETFIDTSKLLKNMRKQLQEPD